MSTGTTSLILAASLGLALPGVAAGEPDEGVVEVSAETAKQDVSDAVEWTVQRVGGDREIRVTQDGEMWRCGDSFTEAALPVGYPAPTPPGAIELKKYPSVRRAQVSGDGSADAATNTGFWQLFGHIKKNDIAMTAPVEMIYSADDMGAGDMATDAASVATHVNPRDAEWTMSFLYRSTDNGPVGEDGSVKIIDAEPVTVLAIGHVGGNMSVALAKRYVEQLTGWLNENPQWELAGDPRSFGYNGPYVPRDVRWWEVQLPVRPAATPADDKTDADEKP